MEIERMGEASGKNAALGNLLNVFTLKCKQITSYIILVLYLPQKVANIGVLDLHTTQALRTPIS